MNELHEWKPLFLAVSQPFHFGVNWNLLSVYSLLEYFRSNTSSVGGAENKGLLGFFKFNRRKSKVRRHSSLMFQQSDIYPIGLANLTP